MTELSTRLLPQRSLASLRWAGWGLWVVLVLVVAGGFGEPSHLPLFAALGGVVALSNVWFTARVMRQQLLSASALAGLMAADLALLTAALALTGGAMSPFTAAFLFYVVLAGIALPVRHTLGVVSLTVLCYGLLFAIPMDPHAHHRPGAMQWHVWGMFAGHLLVAPLLGMALYQLRRTVDAAASREQAARMAERKAERLSSLATLAAGAAHELATPLNTILIVSREQQREARDDALMDDLVLIEQEVERCREVLGELTAHAGSGQGEASTLVDLRAFLSSELDVPFEATGTAFLPPRLMGQVLRRLVGNGRLAGGDVTVRANSASGAVVFEVSDTGSGMSPEVLARYGEPFFTTRSEGSGRGLGVFFARSVVEQLGGTLRASSTIGSGTTVRVELPQPEEGS